MGFFDTIGRGWRMSKLSWAVVRKDPELLVYMVLSGLMIGSLLVLGALPTLAGWDGFSTVDPDTGQEVITGLGALWYFGMYMGISITVVFWNSATVANAHVRLTGGDPKFQTGVLAALSRLHVIILWGIVSGTVGLLIKYGRQLIHQIENDAMRIALRIFAFILEVAWWVVTFFVIPMIVVEKRGLKDAMKESKDLFGRTWGENITSGWGIGIIRFFFIAIAVAIGFVIYLVLPMAGLIVGGVLVALALVWGIAADVVSKAALYIYARSGQMPELYRDQGMADYRF